MTTWTNQTKNTATYSNQAKNTASYSNESISLIDFNFLMDTTYSFLIDTTYKLIIGQGQNAWSFPTKN